MWGGTLGETEGSLFMSSFFSLLQGGAAVFQNLIILKVVVMCKYLHFNLCIDDVFK